MQEKLNIERRVEDQIISFKVAVLAKEKGFNIECLHFYTKPRSKMFGIDEHGRSYPIKNKSKSLYVIGEHATLNIESVFYAPTQSLLQRWLREVHDIKVLIDFETIDDSEIAYTFKIVKYLPEGKDRKKDTWDFYETTYSFNQGGGWYETYEEALEKGLYQALLLL